MTFHLHFPKHNKEAEKASEKSSNKTSPSAPSSPKATPADLATEKFLHDPIRSAKHPDHLGEFVDPMGGRSTYSQGTDVTDTGA
ncbi:hypothetical protein BX666DRAFT_1994064 [Dichotomocladium elegans]|nr:hypothetical protein BX666DRAFT_1994064 [Dichotomocladium elegans]